MRRLFTLLGLPLLVAAALVAVAPAPPAEAATAAYCNPSDAGWVLIAATGDAPDGHRYSQYARTCVIWDTVQHTFKAQTFTENRRDGAVFSAYLNNGDTVESVLWMRATDVSTWSNVAQRGPGYWSDNPGTGPTFTSPQFTHITDGEHYFLAAAYELRVCWTASICSTHHNHYSGTQGTF